MFRSVDVNLLPDCFRTSWGEIQGVALPLSLIDELVKQHEAEEEARKANERVLREMKKAAEVVAEAAKKSQDAPEAKNIWKESDLGFPTHVKILDRHQAENGAAVALLGVREAESRERVEGLLKEPARVKIVVASVMQLEPVYAP